MIARLLPRSHLLIGEQATKQAGFDKEYTQWVRYISLHLPFLALQRDSARTRLLTVNVLSCYHTTCGQIKAEGVFGIARTFLGSGARSVLVALPISTKTFLYTEKVQAKWMKKNRFSNWRQWAPFVLIGDDVSFDFGKPSQAKAFFYFYYFNPNLNSIVTRLVVFVFHQMFPTVAITDLVSFILQLGVIGA